MARADFLRFQSQEITEAALELDEEERLASEGKRLRHTEELAQGAAKLTDTLYEGDEGLAGQLSELAQVARRLADHDAALAGEAAGMEDVTRRVEEFGRAFARYAGEVEFDPARMEAIRVRQDLIFRMKRKYGPELADVVAMGDRLGEELAELDDGDAEREEVLAELERTLAELTEIAGKLTETRTEAAARLASEVQAVLPDLGLEGATFEVSLLPLDSIGPGGGEDVLFRASLNSGFAPDALAKIASGGEVSRIVLALESILARVQRVPTLVFDEIDQGIGGRVATKVAERLRSVSRHHQVFVVTHLPQIASRAEHHLHVEKTVGSGLAETRIVHLDGADRVEEIARMLGGDTDSTVSRDHARALIGGE
jgi:DNA repair protein RecN (Recombination protein N)